MAAYFSASLSQIKYGLSYLDIRQKKVQRYDFTPEAEFDALRVKTKAFIAEHVLPLEADSVHYDAHENIALPVLETVRQKAKAADYGTASQQNAAGCLLRGWAALYEEANRSIFGPAVLNCAAPDDGNINLLSKIGTEAQKDWFLQPLIDGAVRSSFAMTEPAPGSGSDPSMMLTTATRKGDKWIIKGRKWYITGDEESAHYILVARTAEDTRTGLTPFYFIKISLAGILKDAFPLWAPKNMRTLRAGI